MFTRIILVILLNYNPFCNSKLFLEKKNVFICSESSNRIYQIIKIDMWVHICILVSQLDRRRYVKLPADIISKFQTRRAYIFVNCEKPF